jgi:hypothetical protein
MFIHAPDELIVFARRKVSCGAVTLVADEPLLVSSLGRAPRVPGPPGPPPTVPVLVRWTGELAAGCELAEATTARPARPVLPTKPALAPLTNVGAAEADAGPEDEAAIAAYRRAARQQVVCEDEGGAACGQAEVEALGAQLIKQIAASRLARWTDRLAAVRRHLRI